MGLKQKLERLAMGKITGIVLGKIAAGDFGPLGKKLYDAFAGHKTQIAAVIALPPLVIEALISSGTCDAFALPCGYWSTQATTILVSIGAGLAYIGQVDGALRMPTKEAPKP